MVSRSICGLLMAFAFSVATQAKSPFVECSARTGHNASIFVRTEVTPTVNGLSLEAGDEIVAIDDQGTCVGKALWEDNTVAITVWGDDQMTPQKDGLAIGEALRLIVYDTSENLIFGFDDGSATVEFDQKFPFKAEGVYEPDALYNVAYFDVQGDPTTPETPSEEGFMLTPPAPNPFYPATSFTLRLAEPQDIAIRVYNAIGRQVETIHEGILAAGIEHQFRFSGDVHPSGVYLFRVRGERFSAVKSVVLIR